MSWHAAGGIFKKPTILSGTDGFHGVGEAGAEAITPISVLQGFIDNSFSKWLGSPEVAGGTTYNLYLDGAVVNSTDEIESVTKNFIEELVRLGGM